MSKKFQIVWMRLDMINSLIKIKDTDLRVIDGDRGVNYPKKSEFYMSGHCLFLDASNVTKSGFDFFEPQFISKERDDLLGKGKLKRHDIVLTTRGTIGNFGYYSDSIPYDNMRINSGMLIIRNSQDFNTKYLYQLLKSNFIKSQISNITTGSSQPQLTKTIVQELSLIKPSKETQESIAKVLFGLDDKIALNNRINTQLEQSARLLYDYWFTQFDFPDTKGQPYRTSGGAMQYSQQLKREIPEDWEVKRLSELLPVLTGKQDANFATKDGKYNFFTCGEDILKCDTYEFDGKAVLVAGNGNFNIKLYDGKFNAYQRTYVLIPNERKYYTLIYLAVKNRIRWLTNGSRGSIVKFITKGDLEDILIPLPKNEQFDVFSDLNTISEKVAKNIEENQKLTELRDWLLPMLITGQVKVN